MSDLELLRDQEELNGSAADTQAEFVRAALVNLHTSMPGIIKSYDATKQTAEVQPAIKRIVVVDGEVQKLRLPVCLDVPVCMFGNALTAPIAAGDDCLLLFAERCFDRWYASGGVQDPADFRMHDLSDGFAIVGFNSQPAKLSSVRTDGPELRTRDGANRIALGAGGMVFVGTSMSASAASLAELPIITRGAVMAEAIDTLTELPRFVLGGTSLHTVVKP